MFQAGDFAPGFTIGPSFELQLVAGKYVVLCFFGSTANSFSRRVLDDIERNGARFHGESAVFLGISVDPNDSNLRPGREQGIFICDSGRQLSRLYEVISEDGTQLRPQTLIL